MFDQYLEQLASADASQRRQAIIGLGKSGDQRALSPLASIYKNDPDPSLRELALKAGRYLKGLTASAPSVEPSYTPSYVSAATVELAEPEVETPKPELPKKEVSYADRQKAKSRVDYAIGLVAEGKNDKAMAALVEALRINPELVDDQLVINLATNVTGIYATDEAMNALIEKAQASTKSKTKGSVNCKAANEVNTDNGAIFFLIALVVLFILTVAMTIMTRMGVLNELQVLKQGAALTGKQAANFDQTTASLSTLSSGNLFVGSLITTVGTLIYTGVLFGVGSMMGGSGGVVRVFNRMLRVQILMYIPIMALFAFWFFTVLGSITPSPSARSAAGDALLGIGASFLIAYVAEFVWQGIALAKAHEFSVSRGCVSVIISLVMFCVLACAFIFGLSFLLAPMLAR